MAAARIVAGVPVTVVSVDLTAPQTVLAVGLAGQTSWLRSPLPAAGDADFAIWAARWPAAAVANGTFFAMTPGQPVMGTLVTAGRLVNHVAWRPSGTTFGLDAANHPSFTPAGQAPWRGQWLSLTGGPRLLAGGRPCLAPAAEGIHDPDVLGAATRTAIGTSADGHTLLLVSMAAAVSPRREAAVMQALGASDALNLDGGTSRALALAGHVRARPGRRLTNALVVFDARHPAPPELAAAFHHFVGVTELPAPFSVAGRRYDPGPFVAGRVTPYKRLDAGRQLDFEGWRFGSVEPARVRNVDGWLDTRASGDIPVFARWPALLPRFRFEALVSIGSRPAAIGLDVGSSRAGWTGGGLRLQAGSAPRLVAWKQGRALPAHPPVGPPLDAGRHVLRLEAAGAAWAVWIDDRAIGRLPREPGGAGLGVAGPLLITRLVQSSL